MVEEEVTEGIEGVYDVQLFLSREVVEVEDVSLVVVEFAAEEVVFKGEDDFRRFHCL